MAVSSAPRFDRPPVEPLARCCPAHPSWAILLHHLVDDFPEVNLPDIVREVFAAQDATQTAALTDQEALVVGELITRHQLMRIVRGQAEASQRGAVPAAPARR